MASGEGWVEPLVLAAGLAALGDFGEAAFFAGAFFAAFAATFFAAFLATGAGVAADSEVSVDFFAVFFAAMILGWLNLN